MFAALQYPFRPAGFAGTESPPEALDRVIVEDRSMTIEKCQDICGSRGFPFAGLQYGFQCFCGTAYDRFGAGRGCNDPCAGDGSETCGGTWRNYGLSALLRVDDVEIIVITHNGQATDLAQFTSLGVDPTRKSTVIVKSMQHFRAAFEPIAREVLEVDTGALSTRNFKERPYKKVRRPIFPLDDI